MQDADVSAKTHQQYDKKKKSCILSEHKIYVPSGFITQAVESNF